jgi:hypothetical protein
LRHLYPPELSCMRKGLPVWLPDSPFCKKSRGHCLPAAAVSLFIRYDTTAPRQTGG